MNSLLEKGLLPDWLIRIGIRRLLKQRLKDEQQKRLQQPDWDQSFVQTMSTSPIALNTQEANQQHYEVPAEFFQHALGKHLKYSCAFWDETTRNLDQAEDQMLELTTQRAQLKDGDSILELGCGWGSLSLYMAQKFPLAKITSVSNSSSQKAFIDQQAKLRGLTNLTIITCDMNAFTTEKKFDRVVSVEMFEHMRNYQKLLTRVANFLNEQGTLFIHIFVHKDFTYPFEIQDDSDWMAKYFFTGGLMPAYHLLKNFQDNFQLKEQWKVSGVHYQKTAEAWLHNMDQQKKQLQPLFKQVYGQAALKWWNYWRIFFMSCAELWGFHQGEEWFVGHYLMERK